MSTALVVRLVNETRNVDSSRIELSGQTAGKIIRVCSERVEGMIGGKTLMEEICHSISDTTL